MKSAARLLLRNMSIGRIAYGQRFSHIHSATALATLSDDQRERLRGQAMLRHGFDEQLQRTERNRDQRGAGPVEPHLAFVRDVSQMRQDSARRKTATARRPADSHRTPSASRSTAVRKPPSDGPTAFAMPNAELISTCQRRRTTVSGNRSAMQANAVPTSIPPPMPCKPRASTRNSMLLASAAQHRRHGEHDDRRDHERLASVVIAKAAENRYGDDRGQQIRRGDPRVQLEALAVRRRWSAAPCRRRSGRARRASSRTRCRASPSAIRGTVGPGNWNGARLYERPFLMPQ